MKISLVLTLCLSTPHVSAFGTVSLPTAGRSCHATSKLASSTLSSPNNVKNTANSTDNASTSNGIGIAGMPSIVPFGGSARPQDKPDKQIVGGKGLGLQEMSRIGVDVPPGFTLTTAVCQSFQETGDLTDAMWKAVNEAVKSIEEDMGKGYGDAENPLLFSCRSGAAVSMVCMVPVKTMLAIMIVNN